eukprot:3585882-Amphidinium_carterae.3
MQMIWRLGRMLGNHLLVSFVTLFNLNEVEQVSAKTDVTRSQSQPRRLYQEKLGQSDRKQHCNSLAERKASHSRVADG